MAFKGDLPDSSKSPSKANSFYALLKESSTKKKDWIDLLLNSVLAKETHANVAYEH